MTILITILMIAAASFLPASLALWFFGVRPYIQKHGKATVTAVNWGLSIWADLTTAYEIGKETGRFPPCVKWLFALQVVQAGSILVVMIGIVLG